MIHVTYALTIGLRCNLRFIQQFELNSYDFITYNPKNEREIPGCGLIGD